MASHDFDRRYRAWERFFATGEIETALFTFYPFTELPGGTGLKATALKVGAAASYGQVTPDGELRLENPVGDRVKGEIRLHGDGPWPQSDALQPEAHKASRDARKCCGTSP